MTNSHINAVARASPGVKIGNSSFKIPVISRPVHKYRILIKNVVHRNSPRTKVVCYDPKIIAVEDSTLWLEIKEDIRTLLDNLYTENFGHRVYTLKDFTLRYFASGTSLDDYNSTATFGNIWNETIKNTGLCITDKAVKIRTLEITAFVNYPVISATADQEDSDEEFAGKSTRKSAKRKAASSTLGTSVNPDNLRSKRIAVSGPGFYLTNITPTNVTETAYMSYKTECIISEKNVRWIRSEAMQIYVEQEKIGSGKTKEAFKIRINNSDDLYAGKRFYYIGDGSFTVSKEDNDKHLHDELLRQKVAQKGLEKFNNEIRSNKINAYDIRIADTFLLTVIGGEDDSLTWIVDPLQESFTVIKLSGTNEAGNNVDLMGMTCDAFAHFSLYDSSETCVFVDIQGIQGKSKIGGRTQHGNTLTLFDLMAHSEKKQMGLGDKGIDGIKEFKEQHQCNAICKQLQLPETGAVSNNSAGKATNIDHNSTVQSKGNNGSNDE
ncbi:hypothetical protein HYPSUDRAFT_196518 [Hypholoma sublateritium FD-334 SS-4]|uniref:Alpha-type protein kinase domain-containing protein n=1 Tax=Hypholoma sublateritium (strain FD-334 SS-4) TaxID=945553 RepID=A0A0D2PE79_HYPSF|nr:hypothetical protein HYPSUDRAFT_196518 [Hypholoma sublateritium FD-334 SS-4]